jgi:acyl carrier protein
MAKDDELFATLCRLIQPFNTEDVKLGQNTDIAADLNIDSVSVMDFVMEVEDEFDIDIPLNVLGETRTLNDLLEVVKSQIAGK